jgi:hypothetical protein
MPTEGDRLSNLLYHKHYGSPLFLIRERHFSVNGIITLSAAFEQDP